MEANSNILSPIETFNKFLISWNSSKITWLILTFILCYLIYKIATRKINERRVSWMDFVKYAIYVVGWFFAMYIIVWDMIYSAKSSIYQTITPLIIITISCIVSFFSARFLFKSVTSENVTTYNIGGRITSGIILAIIIFGTIMFMATDKLDLGLSVVMGGILGGLLALLYDSYRGVLLYGKTESDFADDDWTPPNL